MAKTDKGSRFQGMFEEVEAISRAEPMVDAAVKTDKRTTKSTDPSYTRFNFYLPKDLHKQVKTLAAQDEREMSDIVVEAINQYMEKRGKS
jgi:hypothetical protein